MLPGGRLHDTQADRVCVCISTYMAVYTPQAVEKLIEMENLPQEEFERQQRQLVPLLGIFCGGSPYMDRGQVEVVLLLFEHRSRTRRDGAPAGHTEVSRRKCMMPS